VSSNGHENIATRLRREASATAPERLRADVMLRVRAEPRPQRIRPRRSWGRSFATIAAAACVLGALAFGMSRVDFGGGTSSSGAGGGSAAFERSGAHEALGLSSKQPAVQAASGATEKAFSMNADRGDRARAIILSRVPGPLRGAISGRAQLATPLRHAFGALDPYHQRGRR
jgi:hypothetical protein